MNYIKQLNEFYSTLDYKPLTAEAISVYYILLQIANNTGWIGEFRVANNVILNKCNISERQLTNARNRLVNKGYIEYQKGKNGDTAPSYKIIQLYKEQNDVQTIGVMVGQTVGATVGQTVTPQGDINKQNKTKQKRKDIEKKFIPPTFEEVNAYVEEKQLNVDVKYFYDYFTDGNWIDSKGNPVRNWKQKILTWAKHSSNNVNIDVKKEETQKIYNERGEELQW